MYSCHNIRLTVKIVRLLTLKQKILKSVSKAYIHRARICNVLTYSGMLDTIGPYTLYHMDGTTTVMIDMDTADRIVKYIQQITHVDILLISLCQNLPNNHTPFVVSEIQDLKQLNVIKNDSNLVNHHSIKFNKQQRTEDKARKQYQGASRLLKRLRISIPNQKFLCIDVEAFERRQTKLLEVGVSLLEDGNITTRHFIVQGNMRYRNGAFVADNRDHFLFGESEILPLSEISRIVVDMITDVDVLVGHSFKQDQQYLALHVANIESKPVIDTAGLAKCIVPSSKRSVGLKELMDTCGVTYSRLHNGGNDAHFTLQTLIEMSKMTPYKELESVA